MRRSIIQRERSIAATVRLCALIVVLAAGALLGSIWLLRRAAGRTFALGILVYGEEVS